MKLLDAYRNVLIELDKYESPSFSVRDFNYFWPSATNEFVDAKLAVGPDNIQYDHDDLAVLLSDPTSLDFGAASLTSTQAGLPESYRNMLGLKVVLNVDIAFAMYAVNDEVIVYPRKRTTAREGFIEKNAYQEPKEEDAWYELRGRIIEVFPDVRMSVKSGEIRFLTKPTTIQLNPLIHTLSVTDQQLEVNNPTLEFPDHTVSKIVKVCRKIFLENIESQRYGTNLQELNLRPN